MWGNLQGTNFVVEESSHSEPVQRLITSAADATVVHVRGHSHTQSFFASPEQRRGMSFQLFTNRANSSSCRWRKKNGLRLTWRGERPRDSKHRSARSPAPCIGRTVFPNWVPDPAAILLPWYLAPRYDPAMTNWISEIWTNVWKL